MKRPTKAMTPAATKQLWQYARQVCKDVVRLGPGDKAPCEGYLVNARALEKMADFQMKVRKPSPRNA